MLVELLTGRHPFDADTPEDTLERAADLASWVKSALRTGARGSAEAPAPTRPLTENE